VRYIYQWNQGLAAARNIGLRHSTGRYLVFLDADDRLLPDALIHNQKCLEARPECAFVFGCFRLITEEGVPYQIKARAYKGKIDYSALLQGNHIGMHATVMYRREVFDVVGGFNTLLRVCEDYDMYLRITRQFPVASHDQLVADYRHHGMNMSYDYFLMLSVVLSVLRTQRPYLGQNKLYRKAYWKGIRNWVYYYSQRLILKAYTCLKAGEWQNAVRVVTHPLQRLAQFLVSTAYEKAKNRGDWVEGSWRRLTRLAMGQVNWGDLRRVTPIRRGRPEQAIDCYYLERFLSAHTGDIQGRVVEVGGRAYVRQVEAHLLDMLKAFQGAEETPPITFVADLACVDDLPSASFDCVILPQTLHQVYNPRSVLQTAYRLLKPGGVVLATVPGIPLHKRVDTSYWAFTIHSIRRLLVEIFPPAYVTVSAYGNVLTAVSYLQGISAHELHSKELDYYDPHYQVLIGLRAVKPVNTQGQ
jgi:SAM-dependent methyltransferase